MTIEIKNRSLSCNGKDSQSFLSCTLSYENNLLSTPNLKRKIFTASTLPCKLPTALESDDKNQLIYRANDKKSLILGIDPGITGAIALISTGKNPGFVAVFDVPTYELKSKKSAKKRVDLEAFAFLIESYSKDIILALVEEVGQIGTNADPFSSFVFGFATGGLHGVLASHGIKIQTVHPITWKASLGLDADKEKSLAKAIKFFPEASEHLKRKKDHGRAEALLIAYWANQFTEKSA